jgi:hypothetical protein
MSKPNTQKLLALRRDAVMKLNAIEGDSVAGQDAADKILIDYLTAIGEPHICQAWQDAIKRTL